MLQTFQKYPLSGALRWGKETRRRWESGPAAPADVGGATPVGYPPHQQEAQVVFHSPRDVRPPMGLLSDPEPDRRIWVLEPFRGRKFRSLYPFSTWEKDSSSCCGARHMKQDVIRVGHQAHFVVAAAGPPPGPETGPSPADPLGREGGVPAAVVAAAVTTEAAVAAAAAYGCCCWW